MTDTKTYDVLSDNRSVPSDGTSSSGRGEDNCYNSELRCLAYLAVSLPGAGVGVVGGTEEQSYNSTL